MREKIVNLIQTGFFYILVGNTMTKMISFLSSIIIVRLLSKGDYAALSYADNIYSYIYPVAGLGMASGLLKYCNQTNENQNKAYFFFVFKSGLVFQVLVAIAVYMVAEVAPIPFSEARPIIKTMALYPVIYYILQVGQSYLRAKMKNGLFALTGVVQTVIVFVFTIVLVRFIGMQGIVISRYLAIIIALLMVCYVLFKEFRGAVKVALGKTEKKMIFQLGFSMMIANLFSTIIPANEAFLVNNVIQNEIVSANYKVATLIPSQLIFITNSIVIYSFPIMAQMKEKKNIWKYGKKLGLVTCGLIGTICLLGYLFTPIILQIVYGAQYSSAVGLSKVFWVVYFLHAGFRMVPMNILPALGITKFNALFSIVTCIVHLGVDLVFILKWGIAGVAFGTIFVYFISGIIYWIYLYNFCVKKEKVH